MEPLTPLDRPEPLALQEKPEPFSVMVKPVGSRCNLRCDFCYYLKTKRNSTGMRQECMSDELLERFIRQYIEASTGPEVSFVWHGGEPTLAGLEFYRRAVRLQQRYLPDGWACWNNLQTNGVLLDDEWCSFLAEAGFDVGLSIDGTEGIHDHYRKDTDGNGSYAAAVRAVHRLKAHGIKPDLLCTVTSTTAKKPLETYRALRDLDTGWIQFIPIIRQNAEGGFTPESVGSEAYGDFLCAVFDVWVHHDLGNLDIQMFSEMARIWAGGSAGLCWMAPTCGRALIVEVDGGVYSCDHYVVEGHRIGDINKSHLGFLAGSQVQMSFGRDKQDRLPGQCRECRWLSVCNGGCPKDRHLMSQDGEPGLNYLCSGLSHFFSYARPIVDEMTRLGSRGFNSQMVRLKLNELKRSAWKGVGRNDPCPCGSGRKAKGCCWLRRA